ncbi:Sulfate transporter [Hondaea fermentalgiana]|uniref:Sulfate transporter n=1 Tax=Hondaea fermentalgiana TaxID=2315210 RepID=A0A2R5GQH6_9STRA|nr:Sulfate transporter [Hondaea fermentalgiana]|eukprot:GBG32865.1 Sulfate transporter [Hondaea fermentalgiana]
MSATTRSGYPPIRTWLPKYKWAEDLPYDVAAGLTVGVMAIPQSLSYALIAGLPPAYGLYSDLQICYPIFGSSKFLVVGPVAVMSLMSRFAMEKLNYTESSAEWVNMVCFLSVLVAAIQFLIGSQGWGSRISALLPAPAIAGFSSAAALIIGSTQLAALFGIDKCKLDNGQSCDFLSSILYTMSNAHRMNKATFACGILSFATLYAFRALEPTRKVPAHPHSHLPTSTGANTNASSRNAKQVSLFRSLVPKLGALFVVVASTSLMLLVEGDAFEGAQALGGIKQVGFIPSGLPSPRWIPALPQSLEVFVSLAVSSVPIALVGFAEASAIAKSSTKLRNEDVSAISDDYEVLALAFCNAFTAWVGGYPVTGSFSRTAINAESGARSALSTAIAALAVVVVLLFCTQFLAHLPKAAVSAIVLSAVIKLVDYHEFVTLLRSYRANSSDRRVWVFSVVFMASLVLGVEQGLFAGVLVHFILQRVEQGERAIV